MDFVDALKDFCGWKLNHETHVCETLDGTKYVCDGYAYKKDEQK